MIVMQMMERADDGVLFLRDKLDFEVEIPS